MSQFSRKISCTPDLRNLRESPLNGKKQGSGNNQCQADKLLIWVNEAYSALAERKQNFTAEDVNDLFQRRVRCISAPAINRISGTDVRRYLLNRVELSLRSEPKNPGNMTSAMTA